MRSPREDGSIAAETARALTAGAPGALSTASLMHLQRTAGNASVAALVDGEEERSPVHDVVGSGGGQPLDTGTRAAMETSFGEDFSDVRVHSGGAANQAASSVAAHAFTVGSDVVLGQGAAASSGETAQRTLAHELTHVVQQRRGPVAGSPAAGGINVSDPGDSFERAADDNAGRVMSGQPSITSSETAAPAGVQRKELPEDEELAQRMTAQREADELPEDKELEE
jgi:hypothetical protein